MKHLKKFNEATVPLRSDGQGEYTTDVFDVFMRKLIDTMEWSGEDVLGTKRVQITMPASTGRNASSVSYSKDEALEKWDKALKSRGSDKNVKWYVWLADMGGSMNKPKQFSSQRFDIDSIIDIVNKYPDSVRRINIASDSDEQSNFGKMLSDDYYKPGNYTGD